MEMTGEVPEKVKEGNAVAVVYVSFKKRLTKCHVIDRNVIKITNRGIK